MFPGVNCDCMPGQTDYCETCEMDIADCPCWQEEQEEEG